jgi:hypothetical protein
MTPEEREKRNRLEDEAVDTGERARYNQQRARSEEGRSEVHPSILLEILPNSYVLWLIRPFKSGIFPVACTGCADFTLVCACLVYTRVFTCVHVFFCIRE